jgi:hypothetical protein
MMLLYAFVLSAWLFQDGVLIEGVVKRAGTDQPVPKAVIELHRDSDDSVEYTVSSGDDGRYVFRNVHPDRYRITASRSGYVRMEYGQRAAGKRGTPLDIVAGRNISGMQFALTPTAAIAGRVYGMDGHPIVKATVRALKPAYQNGSRTLTAVQTTITNDRGEYRLFWLPPGRYFVGVNAPDWQRLGDIVMLNSAGSTSGNNVNGGRFGTPLDDPLAPPTPRNGFMQAGGSYLPVYYPNTSDEQAAEAIELAAAAAVEGVDIRLVPLRTRRVRGVVIDGGTGRPFVNSTPGYANSIQSLPRADTSAAAIVHPTTGAFDVPVGVGPVVLFMAGVNHTGSVRIPAGDTDLDGIQIVVTSGFNVRGQIRLDGIDPPSHDPRLASMRVTLRTDPGVFMISPPPASGVPSNTGEFVIQNVTAGDYRINVAPLLNLAANPAPAPAIPAPLQNAYVKSIQIGSTDLLANSLQVGPQPPDEPIVAVVGLNVGSVSGTAVAENQMPVADATVVLVPDGDALKRPDLYRTATSDAAGHFKLTRIVPGRYKLFGWDNVDLGAWLDPQFMTANENAGKPIAIGEGSAQEVQIPVTVPK